MNKYVKIENIENDKIKTYTQYNSYFIARAKKLGGKWNNNGWVFDSRIKEDVKKILNEVYFENGDFVERIDVEITVKEDIVEKQSPIFIGGRLIASASGRDSGAKTGDGVSFIEDEPDSGGSNKNWTTYISADSMFKIFDLSKLAIKDLDYYAKKGIIEYKIVKNETNIQEKINFIKAEIKKLQAELAILEQEHSKNEQ